MSKVIRWGILGAGRIAEKFCTAIGIVEGAAVYAVASRNSDNAKSFASKFGATVFYDDYDTLMKDANVDIVYVATPHAFHHSHTIACLRHKKAVLCEKPLSLSYAQTSEMIKEARDNGVFLMEGMWTSCMPIIQQMQAIINKGTIGPVQYLSADFGFNAPVDLNGRLYNKSLGGGAIMDVGVYPLYLITALLGEPAAIKTVAKITETGVDEYANILFQYPGGATAHLFTSITCNTPIEAQIIGSLGSITLHNPWFKATEMTVQLTGGTSEIFSIPHEGNGFEHEIKEVLYCLQDGLLESDKMPHQLTLSISKTLDEILGQAGVNYI